MAKVSPSEIIPVDMVPWQTQPPPPPCTYLLDTGMCRGDDGDDMLDDV